MPRYTVHVTLTFPGRIEIDADTALEAEDQARALIADTIAAALRQAYKAYPTIIERQAK